MAATRKVSLPPIEPLMIYDGDCEFCVFWIRRWKKMTGDKVRYAPFQDAMMLRQFPELSRAQCETAVQFIETDGQVFKGAEAALRSLIYSSGKAWLLKLYQRSRFFAWLGEMVYKFVARHRIFFSRITFLLFGDRARLIL
jgi:predicted DCC family thiol-disulfide oxidoreductase YuxK